MAKDNNNRKCTSEEQKRAIRAYYANKANQEQEQSPVVKTEDKFPKEFPFWARLKISKNRTTLVIDKDLVKDKSKNNKLVEGFVHREATSMKHKGFEEIKPNPDKTRPVNEFMYLKPPRKLPLRFFKKHNKDLDMPEDLKKRYEKNNKK